MNRRYLRLYNVFALFELPISDQPLLFWLLLCSLFIIILFFLVKKRKPLFSNPIEVKYLVTVIVYQPTP